MSNRRCAALARFSVTILLVGLVLTESGHFLEDKAAASNHSIYPIGSTFRRPEISRNNRFVAFTSGDTILVYDKINGSYEQASLTNDESPNGFDAWQVSISTSGDTLRSSRPAMWYQKIRTARETFTSETSRRTRQRW